MSLTVTCLVCGRAFRSLAPHLKIHNMTAAEYRQAFDLPASYPLAAEDLRAAQGRLARDLWESGRLTTEHLPAATAAAADAGRGQKCSADRQRQAERAHRMGQSNTSKNPDDLNPRGKRYAEARAALAAWRNGKK